LTIQPPKFARIGTITQWREDWLTDSVVNHIVTDPTICQSGFDLFRHSGPC